MVKKLNPSMVTFKNYALFNYEVILYPTNIFSYFFHSFLISFENILLFVVLSIKLVHVYITTKLPCTFVFFSFYIIHHIFLSLASCVALNVWNVILHDVVP